jgi:hypothetical protein
MVSVGYPTEFYFMRVVVDLIEEEGEKSEDRALVLEWIYRYDLIAYNHVPPFLKSNDDESDEDSLE